MKLPGSIRIFAGLFLFAWQLTLSCSVHSLESPADRIILTISGAIGVHNDPGADDSENPDQPTARFDLSMLEAPGVLKVVTETPWTDGLVAFEGVLMRDILDLVEGHGKSVRGVALDDYIVDIPIDDFLKYDVILATRIDGKPMKVRENGPLWIIYPWTDVSELRRPQYYSRSIWQLKSLTVLP